MAGENGLVATVQPNGDPDSCLAGDLAWRARGGGTGLPAGVVVMYGGAAAPTGWLLCDGAAVSRTTYADLFTAIGTDFGVGDGSTTFNLPDLRGRVPAGLDASQGEFDALGKTGGAKEVILSDAQMPVHAHGVTDPGHSHLTQRYPTTTGGSSGFTADTSMSGTLADNTLPVKAAATGVTIQDAGGDEAHPNLQPYQVVNYIVKT